MGTKIGNSNNKKYYKLKVFKKSERIQFLIHYNVCYGRKYTFFYIYITK